ncbi:ribosome biogenesis protein Nop16 [Daldinia caldariorum]|uniref:ribosome biogenesis protein Nop16 n=1 Tax=Daldinia caldariorum TaxID=326644 RepID=UPI0020087EA3|nr:ribosome biogenesis protein Nop16 [Daldinia caldariorum]KAI1466483.1 ribosome biogenesis protein Nop16 [Daldinia caldariorum]
MGRDLQKRKRRSSRSKIRQPSSTLRSKRLLNPLGNDLVAKNWNKKETTTQNYRRLGLVSRLKAPTGGVEPNLASQKLQGRATKPVDPFAISRPTGAIVSEVRVERDENGKIVRVLGGSKRKKDNPLNDPLNDLDSDEDDEDEDEDEDEEVEEWGGIEDAGGDNNKVVAQLEEEANRPVNKKPRTMTKREIEWLQSLVDKYGDDTKAMSRDRKLNPMQQTEADIARRIKKWRSSSA